MLMLQVTRACSTFRVMQMISVSRVFNAATKKGVMAKRLTLDGDDELRDDGEDLSVACLEHVECALDSEEAVGLLLLTNAFEEDWQVVVVVQLLDVHLPEDLVLGTVLDANGQVATVVESAELAGRDRARQHSASTGLLNLGLGRGGHQRGALAPSAFAFEERGYNRFKFKPKNLLLVMAADCSARSVLGMGLRVLLLRVRMYSGGKSPKGECWLFGRSLLLEAFHFLAEVMLSSFFMWSSLIMDDAWWAVFSRLGVECACCIIFI